MANKIEQVNVENIVYGADGCIPVIVQDYESGEVLLLAKMNSEAIDKTFETNCVHYYNGAKNCVEKFGAVEGNT